MFEKLPKDQKRMIPAFKAVMVFFISLYMTCFGLFSYFLGQIIKSDLYLILGVETIYFALVIECVGLPYFLFIAENKYEELDR